MLGPAGQWALDFCMLPFDAADVGAGLTKRAVSPGFVTGAARALPQTLHEVPPPAPAFVK